MLCTIFISLVFTGLVSAHNLSEPAPDFILTDLNGNKHTLQNYKGKVVYIF